MALAQVPGRDLISQRWLVWNAAVLLALMAASARGAETITTAAQVVAADTLVVRAAPAVIAFAPATGSVVSRVDLTDAGRARDLSDVLGRTAGLQMRRFGGIGASAVPSLRGSAAGQIRILIDGIPLNDAQTGQFDLSRLPADRFSAAEIYRGVVPVGFGNGGIGAINLISRDDPAELSLRMLAGSFGEVAGHGVWGVASPDGATSAQITAHGMRADNRFEFTDHRYTFDRTDDDIRRVRENAWVESWSALARLRYGGSAWQSDLRCGFSRRDGGRPGPVGYESPDAQVRYDRLDGALGVAWREDLLRLDLAASRGDETLQDPLGEVGYLPPGTRQSTSDDVFGRLTWAPWLISRKPSSGAVSVRLLTGLEGRRQWFRQTYDDDDEPLRERSSVTAFASVDLALAADRFVITPSWRWQRLEDNFPPVPPLPQLPEEDSVYRVRDDVSPAVGMVWTVQPRRLFLEAHLARTVRQPTWIELFGHRGGINGNRELLPERIDSADVALTVWFVPEDLSLRTAVFTARTDDAVVFLQNSQQTSKAFNIGGSRTRGLELELAANPSSRLEVAGNLTWQSARDDGDDPLYHGKELPFLPEFESALRLNWRGSSWRPWCEAVWQSGNYRDRANSESNKAPSRFLLDLGLAYGRPCSWCGPTGRITLEAMVANLTDNQVYDVEGFPLPGRSWRVALVVGR